MTEKMIYVNLPVKDLPKAKAFFGSLGYEFEPRFTNDDAACMIISDTIYAMLITEPFFRTFTPKPIGDSSKTTEVLVALSAESRDEVDRLLNKALEAGGKELRDPIEQPGMYGRAFEDLDGHIWESMYMDEASSGGV